MVKFPSKLLTNKKKSFEPPITTLPVFVIS